MDSAKLKGAILILSGPSGAGKSSLYKILAKEFSNHYFSISSTTRAKREGEIEGVHYHFISEEEFFRQRDNGEFLEWAEVHGNFYGTSKKQVEDALKSNKIVIFDIDVQGQVNLKKAFPRHTTSVFITTHSKQILEQRLCTRSSDSKEIIQERLKNACDEMRAIEKYDYFLINDDLESCAKNLICIANMAFLKTSLFDIDSLIIQWNK